MIARRRRLADRQGTPRRALVEPGRAAARRRRRGGLDRAQEPAVDRDRGPGDVAGALGAQEGDQVAVLLRRPEPTGRGRPWRRWPSSRPSRPSWRPGGRSRIVPVATSLTVTPSAATSRASVFRKPTSPGRCEFESVSPGIGSRVELEPTLTIRPQPRSRIAGRHRADQQPRREDQRVVGLAPVVDVGVERRAGRRPAGVRDQDLDRSESLGDLAREHLEPLEVAGVGYERLAPRPRSPPRPARGVSSVRLAIATLAPSRASASAIPRPIPSLAPDHQRDPALDPQIHGVHATSQRGGRVAPMADADLYEQIIAAVDELGGGHAGHRALHAKGSWCEGTFTATPRCGRALARVSSPRRAGPAR